MSVIKNAWQLGKGFFFDRAQAKVAWSLAIFSVIFELAFVYTNVALNKWNNDFYNALQELNKKALYDSLVKFAIIVTCLIVVFVLKDALQRKLSIKFRKWMTEFYLDKWVKHNSYLSGGFDNNTNDNPDQRISQDIDSFVNVTIRLSFGLLNCILSLLSFVGILWSLSGILNVTLFNRNFDIPGFLVFLALIYAGVGTAITYMIGKKLAFVDYLSEQKEANFRFAMMRFRENAESIALYRGTSYENNVFKTSIDEIVQNFNQIININVKLGLWKNLYSNLSSVLPIIAAFPQFLAKQIQLGGLMQIKSAFMQVQSALSFLITSFNTIAAYKAVIDRLMEFNHNIDEWDISLNNNKIQIVRNNQDNLVLRDLYINTPTGSALIQRLNLTFMKGKSYLITGKNGAGKSCLIKALGGIWYFGEGSIVLPENVKLFFVPQKIYMAAGSLLQNILYPNLNIDGKNLDEASILMDKLEIGYLKDRLFSNENWTTSLSGGEQQKIAILRALINKPDILIMDESTSAMTERDEKLAYELINEILPDVTIITVGHRSTLKEFHDEEICLS